MRYRLLIPLLVVLLAGCGESTKEQAARQKMDRTAWRKLSRGMTPDQVRAILGEPMRVEDKGEVTCWYYQRGQPVERNATDPKSWVIPRGSLLFAAQTAGEPKLAQWREP
jgi:outer membrane protein assembly factor BamE (lipoprotein component of BamABCDE complex)